MSLENSGFVRSTKSNTIFLKLKKKTVEVMNAEAKEIQNSYKQEFSTKKN